MSFFTIFIIAFRVVSAMIAVLFAFACILDRNLLFYDKMRDTRSGAFLSLYTVIASVVTLITVSDFHVRSFFDVLLGACMAFYMSAAFLFCFIDLEQPRKFFIRHGFLRVLSAVITGIGFLVTVKTIIL